jgi:hypothetical protein
MTPNVALGLILAVIGASTGCASRGALGKDSAFNPVANLYSRNWIVAGPTLVGNVIGGTVGIPFYLSIGAFAHCESKEDSQPESCNWASRNMGQAIVVPGAMLGAITGAPFVPLSLLAPEHPVEHLLN